MSLCLVAGQGRLPQIVAQAARPDLIAAVEGFAPDGVTPDLTFRLETLGSFRKILKKRGVNRICFAGAIRRPDLNPARLDAATLPIVPRMMKVMRQGDDAALRLVLSLFEEVGITPIGAHDLVPALLPAPGILAGSLTGTAEADAIRAASIVESIGASDLGQSCIVSHGQALAIEALPGTDWMLDSLIAARASDAQDLARSFDALELLDIAVDRDASASAILPNRLHRKLPQGGLLYKGPKSAQDLRVDMPAIGPATIRRAAVAGLDGVVVAADGVMLLDADESLEIARNFGLFLWVRRP